jgi:PAS domain S-box-containing protein
MDTVRKPHVYAEQVKQLYAIESVGLVGTMVNSAILCFVQRNVISHHILFAWFAILSGVTLLRFLLLRGYQRMPVEASQAGRWGALFIAGAACSGVLWGSAAIWMFPEESTTHQVFLSLILGGMVAGTAAVYSAVMGAFLAYSLPALVPIAVRFLAVGGELHLSMGAMTVLFGILMVVTARRINHMTVMSLMLQHEKQQLINYLADARDHAENANQQLTSQIAERRKAEAELRKHREELEDIVAERTSSLVATNERLAREIDVRRSAEEALRENEQRYRELADLLPQPIFESDLDGRLTFANRTALTSMGYTPEDLQRGLDIYQLLVPEDRSRAMATTRRRLAGDSIMNVEYTAQRKDGSRFPVIVDASPILRGKQPAGLRGIVLDITERKKIEEERSKAQRLESLGVLAGGLAHDFNNILTVIAGNISLIKMNTSHTDTFYQLLQQAETACFSARDITQQLLTFSRGGEPVKKVLDVSDPIRDSVAFALHGSNLRCNVSVMDGLWPAEVDEGQLHQVINNLVINAKQAMPDGGTLDVRVENSAAAADRMTALAPGRYVRITIEDRGVGIAPEHLPKIFDPYFTTKPAGTGLGLATAYSIVSNHGGGIAVDSQPGRGTVFSVYLPASDKEASRGRTRDRALRGGRGRILVMDDEPMVREVVGMMLRHIGYDVDLAAEGAAAVSLYQSARRSGRPFDAVIMDLTVAGGMGGKEAVRNILEVDPHAKVIVSSGYSNDPILSKFGEYGFKGMVAKPYEIEELARIVRNVLESE